jgi:hypothetical protein
VRTLLGGSPRDMTCRKDGDTDASIIAKGGSRILPVNAFLVPGFMIRRPEARSSALTRMMPSEAAVSAPHEQSQPRDRSQCQRRQLTAPGSEPAVTSPFHPLKAAKASPFSRSGTLK